MIAYNLKIHGLVQGVYYRQSTVEKALELGIKGTVRNCVDGTVEVVAEGDPEKIKMFIDWCHLGPRGAKVESVDINEQPLKNFSNFIITR